MKNRSRNEIIAAILEVINRERGPSTRTKIMYGAFLSYNQLNEYLSFVIEIDLIVPLKSKTNSSSSSSSLLFKITERGTHFLNVYNQISEMITIIQT
jgi:predicted transcriptional regulator